MTVTALLTCFNRREQTVACLRHLFAQALPPDVTVNAVVIDDGSSDGTSDVVKGEFPNAVLLRGDGSLFWCGGMRKAWEDAARKNPDYYLLLNDDTLLNNTAVDTLIKITGAPDAISIAVAAISDPSTGVHTYGGIRDSDSSVPVSGRLEICETFNANAVLIPRAVYQKLGVFHAAYTHAMGDFDYGYAATRQGIKIIQSAESLGTCSRNTLSGTWKDKSLSRRERFKKLQSPKGLPWKEWVVYNRRNAGWIWPWRCISPILRILCGR